MWFPAVARALATWLLILGSCCYSITARYYAEAAAADADDAKDATPSSLLKPQQPLPVAPPSDTGSTEDCRMNDRDNEGGDGPRGGGPNIASCFVDDAEALPAKSIKNDPWFVSTHVNSYHGDTEAFWDELDCDDVFAEQRPIHNQSTWMLLRGAYIASVGPQYSTIDDFHLHKNGFQVKTKVVQIPAKGRGVVALEDIPQGTLVWRSTQTARFPSVVEYRRFLLSLPDDLACDVMIWAYVEKYDFEEGEDEDDDDEEEEEEEEEESVARRPVISVDLDEGSFMNTINTPSDKNIDNHNYRTNRLVKAEEELVLDYGDFEDESNWDVVGFRL